MVRPGGPAPADRLNLLAAPLGALDQPEFFHGWVRETAGLLARLLAPLSGLDAETARSQVSAALLQVVLQALEQRDPAALGLDTLQAELQAGGYRAAAAALAQLAGGPADALFAADAPPLDAAPIVALGPPQGLPPALGRHAAQVALRRLLPPPAGPERTVVLLDTLAAAWGHPPLITDLLTLAAARGGGSDLWLLPASGEAAALLDRRAGRALIRGLRCQVLFGPAAAEPPAAPLPDGDPDVAALLALAGVPPAAAAPLALLPPDQALVVTPGRSDAVEIVLGDLARHA